MRIAGGSGRGDGDREEGKLGGEIMGGWTQASTVIKNTPARARRWRRRQQGRLLNGHSAKVIRALEKEQRPDQPDHPVTKACRYLGERSDHLDYQGARQAGRPIGPGEIESGLRHVIQQRLNLAGAWWKESHAQPMLNLRIHRANNHWDQYWQTLQNRPSLPNAPG